MQVLINVNGADNEQERILRICVCIDFIGVLGVCRVFVMMIKKSKKNLWIMNLCKSACIEINENRNCNEMNETVCERSSKFKVHSGCG